MSIALRLILNLLRLSIAPVWALVRRMRRGRAPWVRLRLHGLLIDLPGRRPKWLNRALSGLTSMPVSVALLRALGSQLKKDARRTGLLLEIDGIHGGWATLHAVRAELLRIRESGKRVVAWLPSGGDQKDLYVASAADLVLSTAPGSFTLLGPVAARTYLAPLLTKLGVEIDVLAEGAYKTAAEPLARARMSDAEREQLGAIVNGLQTELIDALSMRHNAVREQIVQTLARGVVDAAALEQAKLLDGVRYEDELLRDLGSEKRSARTISAGRYQALRPRPWLLPLVPKKRVAILRLIGPIGAGAGRDVIAHRPVTAALRALAKDDAVAGVLLFIDSPGGSAVVSDLLHREVVALAKKKPTVAWLGNIAASGGYYLAVGAETIVCAPTTITGSIGVISARPVLSALMEQAGVYREVVKSAPHADLHSVHRALSADERALLEAETERFYGRFLQVVAEGRKQSVESIRPLAGGRVWIGRDAHERGLVDIMGGYAEARAKLDGLLDERGIVSHPDPIVVAPALRDLPPPPPALLAMGASFVPELHEALEIVALARRGERVLAYAQGLTTT